MQDGESSHSPVSLKPKIIDFSSHPLTHAVPSIKPSHKDLGTIIVSKLNFEANCDAMCKQGLRRLLCLEKLSYLGLGPL